MRQQSKLRNHNNQSQNERFYKSATSTNNSNSLEPKKNDHEQSSNNHLAVGVTNQRTKDKQRITAQRRCGCVKRSPSQKREIIE